MGANWTDKATSASAFPASLRATHLDDVDHFQINNDIDWDALIDLEVSTSEKPSELTSANDSFNGQPAFDDEFCTPLPQENRAPCPTIERKKSVEESLSRSIFTLDDIDFDL